MNDCWLLIAQYDVSVVDSTFFGQNFEIFFDRAGDTGGSLCAFGPTSEVRSEYVFGCFGGPKSGRSLTVYNQYTSGITLCDVKLMGKSRMSFLCLIPYCGFVQPSVCCQLFSPEYAKKLFL